MAFAVCERKHTTTNASQHASHATRNEIAIIVHSFAITFFSRLENFYSNYANRVSAFNSIHIRAVCVCVRLSNWRFCTHFRVYNNNLLHATFDLYSSARATKWLKVFFFAATTVFLPAGGLMRRHFHFLTTRHGISDAERRATDKKSSAC